MKKRIIISGLILASVLSCTPQDKLYVEYYKDASKVIYAQKAENLTSIPGYLSATLSWSAPKDPSCTDALIYWDYRRNSILVNLAENKVEGTDVISVKIPDLVESDYVFEVIILDKNGNKSLASETIVSPKGPTFLLSLNDRLVNKTVISEINNSAIVKWDSKQKNQVYSEFRYTDTNSIKKTVIVDPSTSSLDIKDMNFSNPVDYEYRTVFYNPSVCCDTIKKEWISGKWYVDEDYANGTKEGVEYLTFRAEKNVEVSVDKSNPYQFTFKLLSTAGGILVDALKNDIPGTVIVYQYKSEVPYKVSIYWGLKGQSKYISKASNLSASPIPAGSMDQWSVAVYDVSAGMKARGWPGVAGDWGRLALSAAAGDVITVRNVHFRAKREGE